MRPVPAQVGMLVDDELHFSAGQVVELSLTGAVIEVRDRELPTRSTYGSVVCALGPAAEVTVAAVRQHELVPGTVAVVFPELLDEDREQLASWLG